MATAATRRTTAKSNVVDFDAARKKGKGKTKPLRAFGKDWPTKKANITLLVDFEESEEIGPLLKFVVGHIEKAHRKEFILAMEEDDNIDSEALMALASAVQEAAYPDIPTNPS